MVLPRSTDVVMRPQDGTNAQVQAIDHRRIHGHAQILPFLILLTFPLLHLGILARHRPFRINQARFDLAMMPLGRSPAD